MSGAEQPPGPREITKDARFNDARPHHMSIPAQIHALEQRYGSGNLLLLEGRARLTAAFIDFARARTTLLGAEPKLALSVAAFAACHPVGIAETSGDITDLSAMAASRPQ